MISASPIQSNHGNANAVASLISAADRAYANNERRRLPSSGNGRRTNFEGIDLTLRLLASGEDEFPDEPILPLYRAAFSIIHPGMRHDKKMHRIFWAALQLENSHANPANSFSIGGPKPLQAIKHCLRYCEESHCQSLEGGIPIGRRFIAAARLFYPDDMGLFRQQQQFNALNNPQEHLPAPHRNGISPSVLPPAIKGGPK